MPLTAIIVIGRNEGDRLRACLDSLPQGNAIIYVDSGSTDHSLLIAQEYQSRHDNLDIVRLAPPFSAARARNEGFACLRRDHPEIEFVQCIDADCILHPGWVAVAEDFLRNNASYAAVAGRLRERFPEYSIYNRLCDIEWNAPAGDAATIGGIALFRAAAFANANGFNPALIAGEEPELCFRLRQAGHNIRRLANDMASHDAAISRFGQYWKRAVRGGFAFAQAAALHPTGDLFKREIRSNYFWTLLLPFIAIAPAPFTHGLSLLLLLAFPLLVFKIARHMHRRGFAFNDTILFALLCPFAKCANTQGQLQFHLTNRRAKTHKIIEYKPAPAPMMNAPVASFNIEH